MTSPNGARTVVALPDVVDLAELYPPLDWHAVWRDTPIGPEWLVEPLLERGRLYSLFSPAKVGKSLLMLEVTAALAAGRPVLGSPAGPPVRTLYVDCENSTADLRERLDAYGYGPADLEHLIYLSFPSLPALDSMRGGQHLTAVTEHHGVDLVVIDTVSRVIGGKENDADTFHALYRYALAPLKARGVTVVRLDHAGKDAERGQRGSSSKESDVDVAWKMTRASANTFTLDRVVSRTMHGPERLTLVRRLSPLRHELSGQSDVDADVSALAARLDGLGIPPEAGRDACRRALTTAGVRCSTAALAAAVRHRRTCPGQVSH